MAQLMPLPLTVSCFSKIQAGFTFLVPADLSSPGKGPLNGCVCVFFHTVSSKFCHFTGVEEAGSLSCSICYLHELSGRSL